MSLLQKILYVSLNTTARIAFKVYFKRIRIMGRKDIPHPCPTIVSPNHPNTMMDPVLMASFVPGWMYFLANYGLFKTPLTNFLMSQVFFSIPVQRVKDVKKGQSPNNLTTIKRCCKVLKEGGTFFMGAEASSFSYRRIRPLKDGVARIALTAAKRKKFKSGIIILPIGTNYSKPNQFKSEIIIKIGQPIHLDNYKDAFKKNKIETIDRIMNDIRTQLEKLTIHTHDEIENQYLKWIETLAANKKIYKGYEEKLIFAQKKLPLIRTLRQEHPEQFATNWHQLYQYFQNLQNNNTQDYCISKNVVSSTWEKIGITILTPIYILAQIINFQWLIPRFTYKKLKLYKSYQAMTELLSGAIFIPLCYLLMCLILQVFFSWKTIVIYWASSLVLLLFIRPFRAWKKHSQYKRNAINSPAFLQLQEQKNALLQNLIKLDILK